MTFYELELRSRKSSSFLCKSSHLALELSYLMKEEKKNKGKLKCHKDIAFIPSLFEVNRQPTCNDVKTHLFLENVHSFFYWNIVDLQYWVSFWCTAKGFSFFCRLYSFLLLKMNFCKIFIFDNRNSFDKYTNINGHEFEQAPGVGDGQGSLARWSPWGHKESDTTEWLNWTEY